MFLDLFYFTYNAAQITSRIISLVPTVMLKGDMSMLSKNEHVESAFIFRLYFHASEYKLVL